LSEFVTEPSTLSYEAIREYAERVGEHYNIYDRAGTADMMDLVHRLGGRVAYADSIESLHVNGPGDFIIYLPKVTSSRRDRFTIAHELGHYFLHYLHPGRGVVAGFGRGMRNRAETQANVFASSLLMPAQPFGEAFKRANGDFFRIARLFEVSEEAAEVRAKVLDLV
jgi:IrrE N-terminal-like domain